MYLNRAIERFLDFCQKNQQSCELKPSSEDRIKKYEAEIHLSFPKAYKELLLWLGDDAGGFMDSFVFHVSCLPRNRQDALELMEGDECADILPEDAIVFAWGNQGYYFCFIRVSEGNDPPVHFYYEDKGITWNAFSSIETFLIGYMDAHEAYLRG